jgi:hypothetical protein
MNEQVFHRIFKQFHLGDMPRAFDYEIVPLELTRKAGGLHSIDEEHAKTWQLGQSLHVP